MCFKKYLLTNITVSIQAVYQIQLIVIKIKYIDSFNLAQQNILLIVSISIIVGRIITIVIC